MFLIHLFVLAAFSVRVFASLFPTHPVATTTWTAGSFERITWKDDGASPHLWLVRSFDVDVLMVGNDTFIHSLARKVRPTKRMQKVHIPRTIYSQDTQFYLRFTSKQPRLHIYSANFNILPLRNISKEAALASADSMTLSFSSNMISTASSVISAPAETTVYAAPLPKYARPSDQDANGDGFSRQRVDMEKLKFRIVFVLWPALIGITMSL